MKSLLNEIVKRITENLLDKSNDQNEKRVDNRTKRNENHSVKNSRTKKNLKFLFGFEESNLCEIVVVQSSWTNRSIPETDGNYGKRTWSNRKSIDERIDFSSKEKKGNFSSSIRFSSFRIAKTIEAPMEKFLFSNSIRSVNKEKLNERKRQIQIFLVKQNGTNKLKIPKFTII